MDPTGATPQEVPTPLFGGRGFLRSAEKALFGPLS